MKRVVITFGLISGVVAGALMWLMLWAMSSGVIKSHDGEIWGYSSMIIALSMVFFGIKSYRDSHEGKVTFLKGLQIGILISLISAICYALSWELYYQTIGGNFMAEYIASYAEKMRASGASQAELDAMRQQMDGMAELYKNFFVRFGMTLMEILPVGIIVTLVSAALLRRRELLPAQAA